MVSNLRRAGAIRDRCFLRRSGVYDHDLYPEAQRDADERFNSYPLRRLGDLLKALDL